MIARILKLAVVAGAGVAAWKAMSRRAPGSFHEQALRSGVAEVEAARSAQLRGASAGLRGFAQQMEHDHAQLNARLAEAAGIEVPALDARQRAAQARMDAHQGEAFDRAWLRHMARAHASAIRRFQREVDQHGPGAAVAAQALPGLRAHARRIDELRQPQARFAGRMAEAGTA